ncbi:hypothetical protein [Marinobacterium aestuariivivens]|uniref:EF-hand domain-containing protein n=1 Tax=Marinobacterium aestuariivivens TaxID=1698799 RepID=A0ABW1ZUP7_9GAMM
MKMVAALLGSASLFSVLVIAKGSIEAAQADTAAPTANPAAPVFNQLDRNADGKLSFLEARQDARLIDTFYRMDLDLDGFLSPYELGRLSN